MKLNMLENQIIFGGKVRSLHRVDYWIFCMVHVTIPASYQRRVGT